MKITMPTHLLPWWLKSPAQRQAEAELRDAAVALRVVVALMLDAIIRQPPPISIKKDSAA